MKKLKAKTWNQNLKYQDLRHGFIEHPLRHSVTPSFYKLKQSTPKQIVEFQQNLESQNKENLELLKVKATNLKSCPNNVVERHCSSSIYRRYCLREKKGKIEGEEKQKPEGADK